MRLDRNRWLRPLYDKKRWDQPLVFENEQSGANLLILRPSRRICVRVCFVDRAIIKKEVVGMDFGSARTSGTRGRESLNDLRRTHKSVRAALKRLRIFQVVS